MNAFVVRRVLRAVLALVSLVLACAAGLLCVGLWATSAQVDWSDGTRTCGHEQPYGLAGDEHPRADQDALDAACRSANRTLTVWSVVSGVVAIGAVAGLLVTTRGLARPVEPAPHSGR